MPKAKKPAQPRVWIELETPTDPQARAAIAELTNNMLARLGVTRRVDWSEREARWMIGDPMGYKILNDSGEWFNLEYLGRPLDAIELERLERLQAGGD